MRRRAMTRTLAMWYMRRRSNRAHLLTEIAVRRPIMMAVPTWAEGPAEVPTENANSRT